METKKTGFAIVNILGMVLIFIAAVLEIYSIAFLAADCKMKLHT